MILPKLRAYQGLAWFGTLQSVSPRVTVLLENTAKAPEDSIQSKTGNISLVQQKNLYRWTTYLAKEVELYRKLSEPQIKGQSILKRLEMHNSIVKNQKKILVVPLKESLKYVKVEN